MRLFLFSLIAFVVCAINGDDVKPTVVICITGLICIFNDDLF